MKTEKLHKKIQPFRENKKFLWMTKSLILNTDGTIYLERYYIIHCKLFALMLHIFHTGDEGECLHDHPWHFISIVIRGGYYEYTPVNNDVTMQHSKWYGAPNVLFRKAKHRHRVVLKPIRKTKPITLVFTSKRVRLWGFWNKLNQWNHYLNWKRSDCE